MTLKRIALATALMASTSAAFAGVSGNVAVSSDYFWRGVTQGGNSATVSGGLDYGHDSGLYVGTWFADLNGEAEVDAYAGFSGEASGFGYDIGYIHYHYPLQFEDFGEVYVSGSYMGAELFYAHDIENENGYVSLSYGFEVKKDVSLNGTVGSYMFKDSDSDYNHVNVSLDAPMGDWGASFAVSVTDMDDDKAVPYVTISREFDL